MQGEIRQGEERQSIARQGNVRQRDLVQCNASCFARIKSPRDCTRQRLFRSIIFFAAMSCANCSFVSGELENICGQCGTSSLFSNAACKLKAIGSHPEAPYRKNAGAKESKVVETEEVPMAEMVVPDRDIEEMEVAEVDDVKTMFKTIMQQSEKLSNRMTTLQEEVKSSKQQTAAVIDEFKKDVKEEIERLEANVDNLTDGHNETKAGLAALTR